MALELLADVLVVGAGTSGCYFAWRLAQAGYHVLVLEKRPLEQVGQEVEVFHMDQVRFAEFGLPLPAGEELIALHPTGLAWSPDLRVRQLVHYAFYVMNKPAFCRRLHRYVVQAGGEILESARVAAPIVEYGAVVGVHADKNGEPLDVRAQIVVDASGIDGAVRTRLPAEIRVETDPIRAEDTLHVCLEFRDDLPPDTPTGLNFYPYHKAFWNPSRGTGAILGIGQPGSYDAAWQKHRAWRQEYFGDPGQVLQRTQGRTPYRRSPFSVVGSGFMAVGDAAFQTKPFSGEGVTSSFTACQIAAEVAVDALRAGDTGRAALWPYNVRYFREQGAKFASMFVQLPAAAELSRREVDFLFRQGLIFSARDFEQMNLHYETQMDLGATVVMGLKLLGGVLGGGFSRASFNRLLAVSSTAAKIKEHYRHFPEDPAQFEGWVAGARSLWGENGR